jgi:undecaprenyl-diphosphatase
MTRVDEAVRDRVRGIVEEHLALVVSFHIAAATVERVLELAGAASESERTQDVSRQHASAVERIEAVARDDSPPERVAAVLVETAAQSLASTHAARAVGEAVFGVLGSGTQPLSEAARRGRSLLRDAVVSSMRLPEALEARALLGISGLPHPAAVRQLCEALGFVATGGGIWAAGGLIAYALRIDGSKQAVKLVTPILATVAFISEGPTKALFARHRPFRHVVKMMLLGAKPRARSLPSGHAATSFAAAWTLSVVWPRRRPVLLALAALVSLSRVYLGAHDPDEIVAGGVLGILLAELLWRPTEDLLEDIDLPQSPL